MDSAVTTSLRFGRFLFCSLLVAYITFAVESVGGISAATLSFISIEGRPVNASPGEKIRITRRGQSIPARLGLPLQQGDQIETSVNAEAAIDFEDGTRIFLKPNTKVRYPAYLSRGTALLTRKESSKNEVDVETEHTKATSKGIAYQLEVRDSRAKYTGVAATIRIRNKAKGPWRSVSVVKGEEVILFPDRPPRGPFLADRQTLTAIEQWKDRLEYLIASGPANERRASPETQLSTPLPDTATSGLTPPDTAQQEIPEGRMMPAPISVPAVIGIHRKRALATIEGEGLTIGNITEEETEQHAPESVLNQKPGAGERVKRRTRVDLVIAKAPPRVGVPSVVGISQERATEQLRGKGLIVGNVRRRETSQHVPNSVISQRPAPGEKVKLNTRVDLELAKAPPVVSIPAVVGDSQARATAIINETGLTVGSVTHEVSRRAAGTVVRQQPVPGTNVAPDSQVDLVVAKAPPPKPPPSKPTSQPTVSVPDVRGKRGRDAVAILERRGLQVGRVVRQESLKYLAGTVIEQRPHARAKVSRNTPVDMAIAAIDPCLIGTWDHDNRNSNLFIFEHRSYTRDFGYSGFHRLVFGKDGSWTATYREWTRQAQNWRIGIKEILDGQAKGTFASERGRIEWSTTQVATTGAEWIGGRMRRRDGVVGWGTGTYSCGGSRLVFKASQGIAVYDRR